MTVPIYLMLDTWNAIGTTFNSIYMNISNGAGGAPVGAAASRAFRLDSNGTSIFDIDIQGNITFGTGGSSSILNLKGASTTSGLTFESGGASLTYYNSANAVFTLGSATNGVRLSSTNIVGWTSAASNAAAADTILTRDAANTLAQRNGTTAQALNIYKTFTDASNYTRGFFDWTTTSSRFTIGVTAAGTGSINSIDIIAYDISFKTNDSGGVGTAWQVGHTGHFIAGADNAYDIGASGATRPRNLFMAGYVANAARTYASLPTAASAGAGAQMYVTDSNTAVFHATVTNGGANTILVVSDGTQWRAGG